MPKASSPNPTAPRPSTLSVPTTGAPSHGSGSRRDARVTLAVTFAFLALLLVSTGCRTYATKTESFRQTWQAGQYDQAAKSFGSKADSVSNGRDAVIWRLEHATALRAAGRYQESNQAFEQAEARMAEYSARAKVRVATEAMATMTTPANLPYEGRAYDRIMAATYRALNYLALGEPDSARPALLKAYQYQQDAVAENARRIQRAQEDAASSSQADTIQRTRSNPQFQNTVGSLYSKNAALKPYSDYVNPFSVWLDGAFFLATAQDLSDLERARKSLERALAFNPNHAAIRADLEACDRRLRGGAPEPVTYVILETGRAALRQQVRIDIPIIFANVSYLGTAWPVLEAQSGNLLTVGINTGQHRLNTATVASLDSIIARDFEDEKPAIITRTLISTLAKGAAAFAANEAASQQDQGLGALVRIATLAYQASVNIADTRSWTTLPKEFQMSRFPTPANRRIDIQSGTGPAQPVTIEEGRVNIVYIHSVSGFAPPRVTQMKLQ